MANARVGGGEDTSPSPLIKQKKKLAPSQDKALIILP